jgi:prevent-host-death family protein
VWVRKRPSAHQAVRLELPISATCRTPVKIIADILVSMTRINRRSKSAAKRAPKSGSGQWLLQDAKARFSELVRKVRSEGPQHVTVHGRDEVVVIAAEDFRRLKGEKTGQALIKALQASPCRETGFTPARSAMVVRGVAV